VDAFREELCVLELLFVAGMECSSARVLPGELAGVPVPAVCGEVREQAAGMRGLDPLGEVVGFPAREPERARRTLPWSR